MTTPVVMTRGASPAMRRVVATLDATAWGANRGPRPGQVAEIAAALLEVLAYPIVMPEIRAEEAARVPADVDELAALLDRPAGELDAGEATLLLQAAMELRRLVEEDQAMVDLLGGEV